MRIQQTPRVLVVDNDPLVVTALGTRLSRLGYFPVPAGTGAQALDAFRFGGIDLIIADLNMPVLDGLGLIQRIRQTSHVPIIVITGMTLDASHPIEFTPNVALLHKPFSFRHLTLPAHDLTGIRLGQLVHSGSCQVCLLRPQPQTYGWDWGFCHIQSGVIDRLACR